MSVVNGYGVLARYGEHELLLDVFTSKVAAKKRTKVGPVSVARRIVEIAAPSTVWADLKEPVEYATGEELRVGLAKRTEQARPYFVTQVRVNLR